MGNQKTNEEFLDKLRRINPTVTPLSPYVKSSEAILCRCNTCGCEWSIRPNNLLNGYGCPKCGLKKRTKTQTKNCMDFAKELTKKFPNYELLTEYVGARRYVSLKCKKCNNEWRALPTNLLNGKGCPVCAKVVRAEKKRRTEDEFQQLLSRLQPDIVALEAYKGNQERIDFSCKKCGYSWKTSPSSIVSGHGCPRCAGNGIYSSDEFIRKVNDVNPHIDILGKYQRAVKPVLCKCKLCGNEWYSKPNNILSGKGCPKCFHSSTSFLEEAIFEALSIAAQGKPVLARDRKAIGKELDIYVPDLKIAIEPGSWKWHEAKLENDLLKRQLCADKGIKLVQIYTDYPGQIAPFSEDCYIYKETISYEKDLPTLKDIIKVLLDNCKMQYCFSEDEWKTITNNAYINSRRRTTDEFEKLVAQKLPTVKVEGDYTGSWNKIKVKCLTCGNVWSPAANSLLQGHGCRRCAAIKNGKKKRKIEQEFLTDMDSINSNIIILSTFETTNSRIYCECKLCGNKWQSLPSNLLKGKGCPACARKIRGIRKRMDPDDYSKQLLIKNDSIELLSKYEKSTIKVRCRCKICNHNWSTNPLDLLHGKGCPKCAYKIRSLKKQKSIILIETGQEFESITAAAKHVGTSDGNISACLRGKTKTAKGYHWKYAEFEEKIILR